MSPIHTIGYEHPETALQLSIGEAPTSDRGYPTKLDWIRAKPGEDEQWRRAADAFNEAYGVTFDAGGRPQSGPKAVPIYFRSNSIPDILDVRYLGFGQGRLAARGTTNYAEHPELANEAETLIVYPPDQPEPVERRISGPSDPYCLGGDDGIPTDKQGKPTIYKIATLYFGLADVGTFTAPCTLQTSSQKSLARIKEALLTMRATGTLTGWIMMLGVKPARGVYWDQKEGKRRRTKLFVWDIAGPVERRTVEIDGRPTERWQQLTIPEIQGTIDRAHERRLLAGIPDEGIRQSGIAPPARAPAELGPPEQPEADGEWAAADTEIESTATELPHNPDDDIPFGDPDA